MAEDINLDHLGVKEVIRRYKDLSTVNGVYHENIYRGYLKRAIEDKIIPRSYENLGRLNLDGEQGEDTFSEETLQRIAPIAKIKAQEASLSSFGVGLTDEERDDRDKEAQKFAEIFKKNFYLTNFSSKKSQLSDAQKFIRENGGTAKKYWEDMFEVNTFFLDDVSDQTRVIPIDKAKLNYYIDRNGNKANYRWDDSDLNPVLTSIYETHGDTIESYIGLLSIPAHQLTDIEKQQLAKSNKKYGESNLETVRRMVLDKGGSNGNVFMYPTADGTGLTFRAEINSKGEYSENESVDLSTVIPSLKISYAQIQERIVQKYEYEAVSDLLDWSDQGWDKVRSFVNEFANMGNPQNLIYSGSIDKISHEKLGTGLLKKDPKFHKTEYIDNSIRKRIDFLRGEWEEDPNDPDRKKLKGRYWGDDVVPNFGRGKAYKDLNPMDPNFKAKRRGVFAPIIGTEDYPDSFLGFMQHLVSFMHSDDWGNSTSSGFWSNLLGTEFGPRGFEFIDQLNDWDYMTNDNPNLGKLEYDYLSELMESLPPNITGEELHKVLRKEQERLELEYDTWNSDLTEAIKQIPQEVNNIGAKMGRVAKKFGITGEHQMFPVGKGSYGQWGLY